MAKEKNKKSTAKASKTDAKQDNKPKDELTIKQTEGGDPYVEVDGRSMILTKDDLEILKEIHKRRRDLAPTKQEIAYLHVKYTSDDLMKALKYDRQGNPSWIINTLGMSAMTLLAIRKEYVLNGFTVLMNNQLDAFIVPDKVKNDPMTYTFDNLQKYQDDKFWSRIMSSIEARWYTNTRSLSLNMIRQNARNNLYDIFSFSPIDLAVKYALVAYFADNDEKWKPETLSNFYLAMSKGIPLTDYEPYRLKVLDYMLNAIVVMNVRKQDDKHTARVKRGLQAVPILYGPQGLGKSTLASTLGLGWSDTIDKIEENSQENIFKRSGNATLDFAELDGMKKADVDRIKDAITRFKMTYNPKFENGNKTLYSTALLIGTTNNISILKDSTGNRRFWPIHVQGYDWDKLSLEFVIRCLEQAYLNDQEKIENDDVDDLINLKEDAKDKDYKDENYSQFDLDLIAVKAFFKDVTERPATKGYLAIYYGSSSDNTKMYFASKTKIETAFAMWQTKELGKDRQDRIFDKRVYTAKVTDFIRDHMPSTRTTIRVGDQTKNVLALNRIDFMAAVY